MTALALAGWWMLAPPEVELPQPTIASFEATTELIHEENNVQLAALDTSAFTAQLWPPTPPPELEAVVKAQPPPPPPPELVLLAISQEGSQRVAALYDKRLNRVFLAQVGDAVSSVIVSAITDSAVELTHGDQRSRLALRKDKS